MKCINILWTGGWDSTFRMIELSLQEVIVQPIYCVTKRNNRENEIEAMQKILQRIREKMLTKAKINDIKFIDIDALPANMEITAAYERISQNVTLGSQYRWLADVAVQYPMIEIGVEKPSGEYSGIVTAIQHEGDFVYNGETYVVDKAASSDDINLVFGNFSFPIINKTERDMLDIIKELHYEDVMKSIWFCHEPIAGNSCGFCRPCQQKMECEMSWLLPEVAQRRYRVFNRLRKTIGVRWGNKIMTKLYRR